MRSRAAALGIALLATLTGPAGADGYAEFDQALRGTWDGVRAALHYLRTGNPMVAELELDGAQTRFAALRGLGAMPEPWRLVPASAATLDEVGRQLGDAGKALAASDLDAARTALEPIGPELAELRRAAGIWWFGDCVAEMNLAIAGLRPFDRPEVALADAATADSVKAAAAVAQHVWTRCQALAPPEVAAAPEFQRLTGGSLRSLPLIAGAVDAQDPERLHLILIELWSFDRLVWLQYG